ncbi:MAG: DUF402 domain-containing protein [Desulfobacteraceae bacterium]|nr:MAG: DUF402 domain-containing protein [Desulfobacteraceae bacterium]
MTIAVKIRGIYATALTRYFLDQGVSVIDPSAAIQERFSGLGLPVRPDTPDVEITGIDDDNGVVLIGKDEWTLSSVLNLLRKGFLDAVCLKDGNRAHIEWPYDAKSTMDDLRHRIVPTLIGHHRLKIICPGSVDEQEAFLYRRPQDRKTLSSILQRRLVWETYYRGKSIAIDHLKTNGRLLSLTPGKLIEANAEERTLLIERSDFRAGGLYDGLNIPKLEGDYALTRIREGSWICAHQYFRETGDWIGTYYNINTGIECHPNKVRYVDLEIDVVQRPGEPFAVIDAPLLDEVLERGFVTKELKDRAESIAKSLAGEQGVCPGLSSFGNIDPLVGET